MRIEHTFKDMLSEDIKTITSNDQTSPNSGYTQAHADRSGKAYENYGRADELLCVDGVDSIWEWVSSEYVTGCE